MPKDYRAITRQTYEEIAPDYAERDHRLEEDEGPLVRETLSAFAEKVGREGRVLDVGSGGGRDSRGLLSMGFEVVGIDNAEGMIRQSKSVEPGINYLVMDFEKLDFPPASFDGVWANASLHHVPKENLPPVLRQVFQVLKPGGYFQLIVKQGTGEGLRENEKFGRSIRRYFAFYRPAEVARLLSEVGFETLSSLPKFDDEWVYALARRP
jgi:SAM-dependent methyltransferase